MLKAAIFDMDGVIVDSHPAHKRAWRKFLELQNKNINDEELEFVTEGRKKEEILQHFLGELSDEQLRILGHQKEQMFREEAMEVKALDGIREFLEILSQADIRLAVASSGSRGRVHDLLHSLNLKKYFKAVVTGDEVRRGKPDPSIFLLATQYLAVESREIIVFEDSVSGVRAAKAAGMTCVGVANNGVIPALLEAGADHIIPHFAGLSVTAIQGLVVSRHA